MRFETGAGAAGVAVARASAGVVLTLLVGPVLIGLRFAAFVVLVTALVERRSRGGEPVEPGQDLRARPQVPREGSLGGGEVGAVGVLAGGVHAGVEGGRDVVDGPDR